MNISDILEFIGQYGWPGVLGVILVLGAWWFVTKYEKKTTSKIDNGFDKLATTLANQNDHLITVFSEASTHHQEELVSIIKTALCSHESDKISKHEESIDRRLNVSDGINDILWDLMNVYNAQRAVVIEFHNSKENLNGLSFIWYDVQYEKQQKGINAISTQAKNIQASNILPIIKRVGKEKSNTILLNKEDIENLYNESTVLYSHLKELKIDHVIYSGLYSDDNRLIGLVALEYHEGYPFHEDLINLFDIKAKTSKISQLLQFDVQAKLNYESK